MKRWLAACLISIFLSSCASYSAPQDLVARALDAMGGAERLAGARTLVIKGSLKQFDPEQAYAPGGDAKYTNDSQFVLTADAATQAVRVDWVKNFHYPLVVTRTFTEIVTPEAGFVLGVDSLERNRQSQESNPAGHAMSGLRLAMAQRELRRSSPLLLVEMRQHPERLSARPAVEVGGTRLPAVDYRMDDTVYTVMFDPSSGLPARIRTADYDNIWGDVDFDLMLSDWRPFAGLLVATRQRYELRGQLVQDTQLTEVSTTASARPELFDAPAGLKAGASRPAQGKLHTQWPIRRQFIGTYLDSDNVSVDTRGGGALRLTELAPGVQLQQGGSHNSLIVEMRDYLIVFDAPVTDGQSLWTIAAAKAKYPGKPIAYLVLTHHHMDHAGGLRAYMAQGATLVVGKGAGPHLRRVLDAPFTRSPDLAAQDLGKSRIVEVEGKQQFADGQREVGAYLVDNPHAQGFLMGYVADARLAWVTDLWAPGRPMPPRMNPGLQSLVGAVKKTGIAPLRFAGGHGSVAPYSLLEGLAALGAP